MLSLFAASFLVVSLSKAAFILREGKVNLSRRSSLYSKPALAIAFITHGYVPLTLLAFASLSYAGSSVVGLGFLEDALSPYNY